MHQCFPLSDSEGFDKYILINKIPAVKLFPKDSYEIIHMVGFLLLEGSASKLYVRAHVCAYKHQSNL